jgi:glutamyl/glutaminyl-tRNA synthetase
MGDVLTLIEKAQETVDEEKAKAMTQKLKKAQFGFDDYLESMNQMKKMGGLSSVLAMMPGLGSQMKDIENAIDEKKMAHFNTVYTQQLSAARFAEAGAQVLRQSKLIDDATDTLYIADVLALCQPKLTGLEALPAYADYFFTDSFPEDAASREKTLKKGGVEAARARLQELAAWVAEQAEWTDAALEAGLKTLAETKAVSTGEYIHAARLALSGRSVGPSFYGLLRVLGRQRVLSRITAWLEKNN